MTNGHDISTYNSALPSGHREVCKQLLELIQKVLPVAEGKVWHGHPVWFLDGNPVVGYSTKAGAIELLFWSGQSFSTPGLSPVGKYSAAGIQFGGIDEIDVVTVTSWLGECITIQWDYENLPKNRSLVKRTVF